MKIKKIDKKETNNSDNTLDNTILNKVNALKRKLDDYLKI